MAAVFRSNNLHFDLLSRAAWFINSISFKGLLSKKTYFVIALFIIEMENSGMAYPHAIMYFMSD